MERKTLRRFTYHGLGFPLPLTNAPAIRIDGEWVPDLNFARLGEFMAIAVALQPAKLSGREVRFLRHHLGLKPGRLAEALEVSRQAVMKWEGAGDGETRMQWPTEKEIRLRALKAAGFSDALFPRVFDLLQPPMATPKRGHALDFAALVDKRAFQARCVRELAAGQALGGRVKPRAGRGTGAAS